MIQVFEGKSHPYIKDAFAVRFAVFSQEQGFDPEIDVDEFDESALHVVYYHSAQPIATARMIFSKEHSTAKIGRVAVLATQRKKGVGEVIMRTLLQEAFARNYETVKLSSQLHAVPFYQKIGFVTQGETYLEEGVEHILMQYVAY